MWRVESKIDEEGLVLVFINKLACFFHHEIWEKFTIMKNLFTITPKIMLVRSAPVEEVRIVVDTADEVTKGVIETLAIRDGFLVVSEVPLANVCGGIACLFHLFGDCNLLRRHSD